MENIPLPNTQQLAEIKSNAERMVAKQAQAARNPEEDPNESQSADGILDLGGACILAIVFFYDKLGYKHVPTEHCEKVYDML
jgi:hypothetical protein